MSKEIEEWRPIKGYERRYEASDWGRVKSLNYNHTGKPQIMIPLKGKGNYLKIHLGSNKTISIHKLIAETFIPIPEELLHYEKLDVHHIDGNRSNNAVWNLIWICRDAHNKIHFANKTISESHKEKLSKKIKGRIPEWLTKEVLQFSKDGKFIKKFQSLSDAARELGIYHQSISNCCHQKPHCRTAGGFIWKFA